MPTVARNDDFVGTSQDRPRGFDRCLPAIRVFSILFILYISLFWVRYQMIDGREWRRGAGDGFTASKDDLMRLYGVSVYPVAALFGRSFSDGGSLEERRGGRGFLEIRSGGCLPALGKSDAI